jgi:beta-lactamase regulating signal transducer with metallopeptidase domain
MSTAILFAVTALVNAIWQPALIAAIAGLALKLSRCSNATTRHAVWTFALVASAIVPIVSAMPVFAPHTLVTTQAQTATNPSQRLPLPAVTRGASSRPATSIAMPQIQRPSFEMHPTVATIVSIVWLVVALGILARLLISFLYLERLKHDALPFAVESRHALTRYERAEKGDRDVRVCVSSEITVPVAVGIFDAMILVPSDLVAELDANDLDRILLHELAHVRRSDDWVNLFERVAQALFFFSPGIYWISRQMDLEREVACDDWVLEQSAENVQYARCLARIVEITQWPYTAPAAPGVFVTRKSMSIRIERLLARGRDIRLKPALVPSLLSLAFIVAIVIAGGFVSPTIAYTMDQTIVAHRPAPHVASVMPKKAPAVRENAVATSVVAVATATPAAIPVTTAKVAHLAANVRIAVPAVEASVSTQVDNIVRGATAWAAADGSGATVADASYLDDLAAAGYKNLTPDQVIELKSLGVDGKYIDDLRSAGLKNLSPRELVELKSLGVGGDYIRALTSAGYPHLQTREYVELKSLDVDGQWFSDMRNAGLASLSARDAVELKSLSVDGAYVQDLANAGYPHLSAGEYARLKALGVDGDYIRKLQSHGFTHLTVNDIAKYKALGISQ